MMMNVFSVIAVTALAVLSILTPPAAAELFEHDETAKLVKRLFETDQIQGRAINRYKYLVGGTAVGNFNYSGQMGYVATKHRDLDEALKYLEAAYTLAPGANKNAIVHEIAFDILLMTYLDPKIPDGTALVLLSLPQFSILNGFVKFHTHHDAQRLAINVTYGSRTSSTQVVRQPIWVDVDDWDLNLRIIELPFLRSMGPLHGLFIYTSLSNPNAEAIDQLSRLWVIPVPFDAAQATNQMPITYALLNHYMHSRLHVIMGAHTDTYKIEGGADTYLTHYKLPTDIHAFMSKTALPPNDKHSFSEWRKQYGTPQQSTTTTTTTTTDVDANKDKAPSSWGKTLGITAAVLVGLGVIGAGVWFLFFKGPDDAPADAALAEVTVTPVEAGAESTEAPATDAPASSGAASSAAVPAVAALALAALVPLLA